MRYRNSSGRATLVVTALLECGRQPESSPAASWMHNRIRCNPMQDRSLVASKPIEGIHFDFLILMRRHLARQMEKRHVQIISLRTYAHLHNRFREPNASRLFNTVCGLFTEVARDRCCGLRQFENLVACTDEATGFQGRRAGLRPVSKTLIAYDK